MSRWKTLGLTAAVAVLGLAGSARGGTVKITFGAWQTGGGGEYTVDPSGIPDVRNGEEFASFCIERNEDLNANATYDAKVNTRAVAGGIGGGSPDPLDQRTAYLYHHFRAGDLPYYDFTDTGDGRLKSAAALQKAIWRIENEYTFSPWTLGDGSLEDRFHELAQDAVDNGAWSGLGNVRVLNLTDSGGARKQDILVLLVPLPSAAASGFLVLAALGLIAIHRRRRR